MKFAGKKHKLEKKKMLKSGHVYLFQIFKRKSATGNNKLKIKN